MTSFKDLVAGDGQRFIDRFTGDALRSWWNQNSVQGGTSTFAMVDAVNEGFSITTSTITAGLGQIDFNGIQCFSNTDSSCRAVMRRVSTGGTDTMTAMGFVAGAGFTGNSRINIFNSDSRTWHDLDYRNTTTTTTVNTTLAPDTSWHDYMVKTVNNTYISAFIDNNFEAVGTTNLPTVALEPVFGVRTGASASKEGRVRYLEAWNH